MLFNSFDFLLFFIFVFLVQLVLPHRARNLFLLSSSYFFYGCWDWRFLGLMGISTLVGFECARRIEQAQSDRHRRTWLVSGVTANLIILGFFKYVNFFCDSALSLVTLAGFEAPKNVLNVVLPVGISFYTFQSISYIVDVYRRQLPHVVSLSNFALFISFFPQLVAGPIERGTVLAPQIEYGPRTSIEGIRIGLWLVLKGLFKKAVIADNLSPLVDSMFALESPTSSQVLLGVYAFAFQIYGDFAGYTDIARGVGKMLGYDLTLNFRLPYFATSPSEFWHRWHISLSSWLRDYLYIPLGGSRCGAWRTSRNLMLTMVLGGLWHGAEWTFVSWGVFHGVLLVGQRIAATCFRFSPVLLARTYLLRLFVMFHLTCFGWLIFRASSMLELAHMAGGLLSLRFQMTPSDWQMAWKLVVLCGPLLIIHAIQEYTRNLSFVLCLSPLPRSVVFATTILAILALGEFGSQKFIYFQF